MKKIFLAVQVDYTGDKYIFSDKQYNNGEKAMYAFTEVYNAGTNIVHDLDIIGGLVSATVCETRKQADEIVAEWNRGFQEKGIYAF